MNDKLKEMRDNYKIICGKCHTKLTPETDIPVTYFEKIFDKELKVYNRICPGCWEVREHFRGTRDWIRYENDSPAVLLYFNEKRKLE